MYIVNSGRGSGNRFWRSPEKQPKTLMSVFGGRSMLQRNVDRVLPLRPKRILVVTNVDQAAETAASSHSWGVPGDHRGAGGAQYRSCIAWPRPSLPATTPGAHGGASAAITSSTRRASGNTRPGRGTARNGYLVTIGINPRTARNRLWLSRRTPIFAEAALSVKRFVVKPS